MIDENLQTGFCLEEVFYRDFRICRCHGQGQTFLQLQLRPLLRPEELLSKTGARRSPDVCTESNNDIDSGTFLPGQVNVSAKSIQKVLRVTREHKVAGVNDMLPWKLTTHLPLRSELILLSLSVHTNIFGIIAGHPADCDMQPDLLRDGY